MLEWIDRYRFHLLFALYLLHLAIAWPGLMSDDSHGIYSAAISGIYGDHHPPLMSFLWRYLDRMLVGPGLMYGFHISMLYAALGVFMHALCNSKYRSLYLLFPFIPPIGLYSVWVWKDVSFAFSFLLCAAILTYLSQNKKRSKGLFAIALALLFYGAAVKYQAQFCAPVLLTWMITLIFKKGLSRKAILISILASIVFIKMIDLTNDYFVPAEKKSHSWQLVKLYDLAAISIATNTPQFPPFAMRHNFTMDSLRKRYDQRDVLPITSHEGAALTIGTAPYERDELQKFWMQSVLKHPVAYIVHRTRTICYTLASRVAFDHFIKLQISLINSPKLHWAFGIAIAIMGFFLAHVLYVLSSLAVFVHAFHKSQHTLQALPFTYAIRWINLCGLTMLGVLFFCSMAGTPRYTYVTLVLFCASIPLFLHQLKQKA